MRAHVRPCLSLLLVVAAGCGGSDRQAVEPDTTESRRLSPPAAGSRADCAPGVHVLRLGGGKRALMRVTAGSRARNALILVLHGAGGSSRDGLYAFRGGWKAPDVVMLAPAAAGSTWSSLSGADVDLPTVDAALRRAFARCRIDRRRVAVGGFSDGATYALSLGLANGGLFSAILALSPGGVVPQRYVGKPRVLVAHGIRDDVLPISRTSDAIVNALRGAGYAVTYRKFDGGHEAPAPISRAAVRWFLRA
ncbi:MAG: alpha/beta hydrolase [Gaiellaceae bacterium]